MPGYTRAAGYCWAAQSELLALRAVCGAWQFQMIKPLDAGPAEAVVCHTRMFQSGRIVIAFAAHVDVGLLAASPVFGFRVDSTGDIVSGLRSNTRVRHDTCHSYRGPGRSLAGICIAAVLLLMRSYTLVCRCVLFLPKQSCERLSQDPRSPENPKPTLATG